MTLKTAKMSDQAIAEALQDGNPVLKVAAHAAWEACRAFKDLSLDADAGAVPAYPDLPSDEQATVIAEVFAVIQGARPQDIYAGRDYGDGLTWDAALPSTRIHVTLFCHAVGLVLTATQALASAAEDHVAAKAGLQ